MDGFMVFFGLVIWFFAVLGLMMGGKGLMRWLGGLISNHPEGFRKCLGLGADGSARSSRLEEAMGSRG